MKTIRTPLIPDCTQWRKSLTVVYSAWILIAGRVIKERELCSFQPTEISNHRNVEKQKVMTDKQTMGIGVGPLLFSSKMYRFALKKKASLMLYTYSSFLLKFLKCLVECFLCTHIIQAKHQLSTVEAACRCIYSHRDQDSWSLAANCKNKLRRQIAAPYNIFPWFKMPEFHNTLPGQNANRLIFYRSKFNLQKEK